MKNSRLRVAKNISIPNNTSIQMRPFTWPEHLLRILQTETTIDKWSIRWSENQSQFRDHQTRYCLLISLSSLRLGNTLQKRTRNYFSVADTEVKELKLIVCIDRKNHWKFNLAYASTLWEQKSSMPLRIPSSQEWSDHKHFARAKRTSKTGPGVATREFLWAFVNLLCILLPASRLIA